MVPSMHSGRILFIDAYDSFSNSIIALVREELPVTVESIKIDDPRFSFNPEAFTDFLSHFDAVIAGPGPGHPANASDVGLIRCLWALPDQHFLPVLGICLGFQSLCLAFGAQVTQLNEPRHGVTAGIAHCGSDVFAGAGKIVATQYHSLHVQPDRPRKPSRANEREEPLHDCDQLLPLAWDVSNAANGSVLMAARHCYKPFWGVQYHPESICTNQEGRRLIQAWWMEASVWPSKRKSSSKRQSDLLACQRGSIGQSLVSSRSKQISAKYSSSSQVYVQEIPLEDVVDVADICELLRKNHPTIQPLLLESGTRNGMPVNPETGRFSIVGLPSASSLQIRYCTSSRHLNVEMNGELVLSRRSSVKDTFRCIDDVMECHQVYSGPANSPFWGGLVGFISYEAGLETIGVPPASVVPNRPDLWFQMVDRSVVIDHAKQNVYIQSLRRDDGDWIQSIHQILKTACGNNTRSSKISPTETKIRYQPRQEEYFQEIRTCQSHIRAGSSYELCLTDQTRLEIDLDAWSVYRQIRTHNPAPFGTYLRMESAHGPGISVASTSPERFLSWTREGRCQFRPIKGTVKKTSSMTRARAEELLASPKERAENLMIVDLIRHDLYGVQGVERVDVPKLMSVEEYETVFQLVSVIEGDLAPNTPPTAVLAASLPPGSMTGAPKKRSCELLKDLEDNRPRGLYSGTIGYFDVGGGGDFSVAIRTIFKWDGGDETWHMGAGGAITAMSEVESEWDEMLAKRESVLRAFD